MKKLSVFLIAILFFYETNIFSQDKTTYWVHGYGSDTTFWQSFRNGFQSLRRTKGYLISHDSYSGIDESWGVAAQSRIAMNSTKNPNNIAIAHSMGGLILREIERGNNNSYFGGMISVGSPHYGAKIIESKQNGRVQSIVRWAFNDLTAGLNAITVYMFDPLLDLARNYTERRINHIVAPYAQDLSAYDMLPGSNFIYTINNRTTSMPKIGIYGDENYLTHVRLGSTMAGRNENDDAAALWQVGSVYAGISNYLNYWGNRFLWYAWYYNDYWYYVVGLYFKYCAGEWQRGALYIYYYSQADWNWVISGTWHWNVASDGLFSVGNQCFPNATTNIRAAGVNHSEQKNHPNVGDALKTIFNRPDIFRIQPR